MKNYYYLFFSFLFFINFSLSGQEPAAYWPMENNGNDVSGNGWNLELNGGLSFSSTEAIVGDYCLAFDGVDDYAWISQSSGEFHDALTERTYSFWLKLNSLVDTFVIFDEGGAWKGLGLRASDGKLEFGTSDAGVYNVISADIGHTNWVPVVAVYDNNNMYLYVADTLAATGTCSYEYGEIGDHGVATHMGANTEDPGRSVFDMSSVKFFSGYLDDFVAWRAVPSLKQLAYPVKSVSFAEPIVNDVVLYNDSNKVIVYVDKNADCSNLTPEITLRANHYSVSPASGASQDFSSGKVVYTITKPDLSTVEYEFVIKKVNPYLIAYYPMENSGTDESDNSWDLQLNGGITFSSTEAKVENYSLAFDGVDDYAFISSLDGDFHEAFTERTVQFWMKTNTLVDTQMIFDEGGVAQGFALRLSDGVLEYAVVNNHNQFTISGNIGHTEWVRVAAVFDNNNMYLYIGDSLAASGTCNYENGEIGSHGSQTQIGTNYDDDGNDGKNTAFNMSHSSSFFNGYIDEFIASNVALSLDEIIGNPVIDNMNDLTVNLFNDEGGQTIPFSGVGDGDILFYQGLTVTSSRKGDNVIQNLSVSYTSPNDTGSVYFEPVPGTSGRDTIVLTVLDDGTPPLSNETWFVVEVHDPSVNIAPVIDPVTNQVYDRSSQERRIKLTGIDDGDLNKDQVLDITAESSDPSIIPHPSVIYTSPEDTAILALTPTGQEGTVTITIKVKDDGGTPGVDSVMTSFEVLISAQAFLDDFEDGDRTGWWDDSHYDLIEENGMLTVKIQKEEKWKGFGKHLGTYYDFSDFPYVNVSIKTEKPCNLDFYLMSDGSGPNLRQHILSTDTFVNVFWDFTGKSNSLDNINSILLTFNGTTHDLNATVYIDEIRIGKNALKMANAGGLADMVYYKNSGRHVKYIANISNVDSFSISGGETLIDSVEFGEIKMLSDPYHIYGYCPLSFVVKEDVVGQELVTVNVHGKNGYEDNEFYFWLDIVDNLPPTIDTIMAQEVKTGENTTIKLTGISDGDATIEQDLSFTVVSDNQSVIPDGNLSVQYEKGSPYAYLTLKADNPGNDVKVTITITDDSGEANDTVSTSFYVSAFDNFNYPPTVNNLSDLSIKDNVGEQVIMVSGISDGNNNTQSVNIKAISSDSSVIHTDSLKVYYQPGESTAEIRYTPYNDGNVKISVVLEDDGAGTDNGIKTTTERFNLNIIHNYPKGLIIDHSTTSGWSPESTINVTAVDSGDFWSTRVMGNNKGVWDGIMINLPTPLDLSTHPFISFEVFPLNDPLYHWLWFYDNRGWRNIYHGRKEMFSQKNKWNKITIKFDGENEMAGMWNDEPIQINSEKICSILYNFHDEVYGHPPAPPAYTGAFLIRNMRLGNEAEVGYPDAKLDPVASQTYSENPGEQTITLTGIGDGYLGSDAKPNLFVSSNNPSFVDPVKSAIQDDGTATITCSSSCNLRTLF